MSGLKRVTISAQKYSLLGVIGEFTVLPDSKWKIVYFSTKASSEANGNGGNSLNLLQELKPMRERMSASQIQTMSALLQRDLNDYRVSKELIPYLLDNTKGIGFFPGILVALMPKGFLEGTSGTESAYPRRGEPQVIETGVRYEFESCWELEAFSMGQGISALGKLDIYPNKTDLVVLDGQHRANAFRFATNTFTGVTGSGSPSVYQGFYEGRTPPNTFTAELPVTIIWFEAINDASPISPNIISRKLFVDVNTTAKPVKPSRNILLDDQTISAICTSQFYSYLATIAGFDADKLSLLHGAFDSDDETEKTATALFTPADLHYALRYFILGIDEFDDIAKTISRDTVSQQNNPYRLYRFFNLAGASSRPTLNELQTGSFDVDNLRNILDSTINKQIYYLFNEFNFIKHHLNSLKEVEQYISSQGNTTQQEVWQKVFCGGEGLYYSFKMAQRKGRATAKMKVIIAGIDEIEQLLFEKRAESIPVAKELHQKVKDAYGVFTTNACLTGLIMALSRYAKDNGSWQANTAQQFVNYLNKTSVEQWLHIFTDLKPMVVKSLEPKAWPYMRNIFLRVIQNNGGGRFF